MPKVIIGIALVAIAALLIFQQTSEEPRTARQAIEEGIAQASQNADMSESEKQGLRVQLAVADYTASIGSPPSSMDDLVPKYFASVPIDPADGKPLTLDAQMAGDSGGNEVLAKNEVSLDEQLSKEGFINPNTMAVSDFVYDPSGKRDPFSPFDFSGRRDIDTSLPPLQRYSIGQLKVSAILESGGKYKAIIEDATGIATRRQRAPRSEITKAL